MYDIVAPTIQGIIDAAAANGTGEALIPAGTHEIEASLILPSNLRLIGTGRGSTILKKKAGVRGPILVSKDFDDNTGTENLGESRFSTEEITFMGIGSAEGGTYRHGCVALYGFDFIIRNVDIQGSDSNGLYTEWGGKLDASGPSKHLKQPASITDLTLTNNNGCGWLHLGPHDTLATRVNSFGNGRELVEGSGINDNGEANIWLAARMAPVVHVDASGPSVRLSSPGKNYKPGVYAIVKSGNNVGMLGWVQVDSTGKAETIYWLNETCVFDEAITATLPIQFVTNLLTESANPNNIVLPAATANLVPGGKYSSFTWVNDSRGSNLPAWPEIRVSRADGQPATRAIILPIVRGGQMYGGFIYFPDSGYQGLATVETIQGSNTSARGVAIVSSGTITALYYGTAGAWMDKVKVAAPAGAPFTLTAESDGVDRFGQVQAWKNLATTGTVQHGYVLIPATGTEPTKRSPMSGGTILSQCHVWGSQTFGIRVSAPAVLTGCEAESAFGANLFLEAKSGTVTDAWIYDNGGVVKGGNFGKGTATAVGIQLGHPGMGDLPSSFGYNSPAQWRISARIDNCHAGGILKFSNGDALQVDLHISSRCGLFHNGFRSTSVASDDFTISTFYGESNFDRYARAHRASIAPLVQQPTDYSQDSRVLIWAGKLQFAEYFKSSSTLYSSVKFPAVPSPFFTDGVRIFTYGRSVVSADALAFHGFVEETATRIFTATDYSSYILFKGATPAELTLPSAKLLPERTMINISNRTSTPESVPPAAPVVLTIKAAGTEKIDALNQVTIPKDGKLTLFSDQSGSWIRF